MPTTLQGIANKAKKDKKHRFGNLFGMLNERFLAYSWKFLKKEAACGADNVTAADYERDFAANVRDLVERLRRGAYRAKLVQRKWIPKGKDKLRPLGLPAVEDKLLQIAVSQILGAIYEANFLACSHGYRPKRGPRQAALALRDELYYGRYCHVVEADIKGFFDNIDHGWMIRMLQERINDKPFLRLIQKWLKAGILEKDGKVLHPVTGTPQGGIISPILANVYLHYALDLWFEKVVRKRCRGAVQLFRYADDFVCMFEIRSEAAWFYQELPKRLGKFNLELSMEKTRMIAFSRFPEGNGNSFDFLGFEYRWAQSRKAKWMIKLRTSRKKFRQSLATFTTWCRKQRSLVLRKIIKALNAKLRGYYNYYGVIGNYASLQSFFWQALRILKKWLNRRSQRRSYNWKQFEAMLVRYRIEHPRITERRDDQLKLRLSFAECGSEYF